MRAQVDEARDVMSGTIDSLLQNQEQLTSLHSKTDDIVGQSRGFYRDARTTRRQAQCEEYRMKLLIACGVILVLWFFFGGWFGGGDDDDELRLHVPPSPPPPDDRL